MDKIQWERLASIAVAVTLGGVILWFGGRLLLSLFLPFLLAWALALCVHPPAVRLSKCLHLPQKLVSVLLLTALLSSLILLLCAAVNRLFFELQELLSRLPGSEGFPDWISDGSFDYFQRLTSLAGVRPSPETAQRYAEFRGYFNGLVANMLDRFVNTVSEKIPEAAAKLVAALPSALFFTAVTLIAGFYISMDCTGFRNMLVSLLPKSVQAKIPAWKTALKSVSLRYVKAYLILLLLTFSVLFAGFLILRIRYAFLLAVVVAVVDILPVLGVGTVLIPWAIFLLLRRKFYLGFGLLILYLVTTLLHQFVEPKLVGKSLGIQPILSLIASYAGWKLLGVMGMIIGPFLALLIKSLFRGRGKNNNTGSYEAS